MAEESGEEKSEAPSEKKRQDAREKGNVAKSTEVNSVLVLFVALMLLKVLGPWIMNQLYSLMVEFFNLCSNTDMTQKRAIELTYKAFWILAEASLPVAGGILIIGVVANVVQVGFLFTLQPLIPKLEKIDPIAGSKRLFSMRSIIETIKSIAKLSIIGIVAYLTIKSEFGKLVMLADASMITIWHFAVGLIYTIILRTILVLLIIAILDFAYQRFENEQKLKMTHQEVKEERKQMEGDPLVKSRIRSLQREMARRRMMEQVPKATVVVTNPTHLAIALRYEPSESDAPVVVAKGKMLIAERIKQIAKDNGIPIIEDKPLARAMFDKVEAGFAIPLEFFTAVAEIMAYVYRLKHKVAA